MSDKVNCVASGFFGKLTDYLGKCVHDEGHGCQYPDINFYEIPNVICASDEHKELK